MKILSRKREILFHIAHKPCYFNVLYGFFIYFRTIILYVNILCTSLKKLHAILILKIFFEIFIVDL